MRDGVWGERALGCPDRGILGGFAAALLRRFQADPRAGGKTRTWILAALTSYPLKNGSDRDDACARLGGLLPSPQGGTEGGMRPQDEVRALPGVGEKFAQRLEALGLKTIGDLLDHVPRDYIDRRALLRIGDLRVGQEATVLATVRETKVERTRSGKRMVKTVVYDGSGYMTCLWWGQEWRAKSLREGTEAAFSGRVERRGGRLQMTNPAYDLFGASQEGVHTGRIVPVYPASEQVTSNHLRRLLHTALDRMGTVPDPLPAALRASANLMPRGLAYRLIHFPETPEQVQDARRRLVFEELFVLQAGLALRKRHLEREVKGISHSSGSELADRFLDSLPFALTGAQRRAMREIAADMARPFPMHRLLQGDVGSGKTIVALHAALLAMGSGSQAAIMAPTEVLAEQLARNLRGLLEPVGVAVALLTSSVPAAQRRDTLMRLAAGDLDCVCGTHALISEDVSYRRLGLAIVDEQHRFGLGQRMLLREKGTDPDVLIMTATPIPRTLALTLYGDLDVSLLDEMPAGRKPVRTTVAATEAERAAAYELVRSEVAAGRRAFVVCALVDESDTLQAKAAVAEAERLRTEVFPDLEVGLLHGQMRSADKDRVMEEFRRGDVTVLIATTVVEVGVDVPEASVMLIENAERFGLSQLHQLRGRVGRGEDEAWCILFADPATPDARARLDAIASTTDGFVLAEEDLRIRGEGTIFGTRQAGFTDLKLARLVEDYPIVVEARRDAFGLVEKDPGLRRPEHAGLREEVASRLGEAVDWLFRG